MGRILDQGGVEFLSGEQEREMAPQWRNGHADGCFCKACGDKRHMIVEIRRPRRDDTPEQKHAHRRELTAAMDNFLANGGCVERVPAAGRYPFRIDVRFSCDDVYSRGMVLRKSGC